MGVDSLLSALLLSFKVLALREGLFQLINPSWVALVSLRFVELKLDLRMAFAHGPLWSTDWLLKLLMTCSNAPRSTARSTFRIVAP